MQLGGDLYFKDHSLALGYGARFWIRVLKGVFYITLGALSTVLILSDVPSLFYTGMLLIGLWAWLLIKDWITIISWVGVLVIEVSSGMSALIIFLWVIGIFARWVFLGNKTKQNKNFKGGNLLNYTTYRTQKLIESAYDKSVVIGGSILLNVARELADTYQVESLLHHMSVSRGEFITRTEQLLKEELHLKETNKWRQTRVEELVVRAFIAQKDKHEPIAPVHLFRGLVGMDSEKTQRLFSMFDIESHKIDQIIHDEGKD